MSHMAKIRSQNTKLELTLRKALFARGLRYRINQKKLPGSPDLVFKQFKAAIFVHGCFWHGHEDCAIAHIPKRNRRFWKHKFKRNVNRDQRVLAELEERGWRTLVVWECSMKPNPWFDLDQVIDFVETWLRSQAASSQLSGNQPLPHLQLPIKLRVHHAAAGITPKMH